MLQTCHIMQEAFLLPAVNVNISDDTCSHPFYTEKKFGKSSKVQKFGFFHILTSIPAVLCNIVAQGKIVAHSQNQRALEILEFIDF